jgi:peptide/nickel transport system permease protein
VIEVVFAIPGMGRLVVDALIRRDYPIIQGMLMVFSVLYIFVNLLVDIAYAYLDPRIRFQ